MIPHLFVIDNESCQATGLIILACPMTGESEMFYTAEQVQEYLKHYYINPVAAKFAAMKTLYARL